MPVATKSKRKGAVTLAALVIGSAVFLWLAHAVASHVPIVFDEVLRSLLQSHGQLAGPPGPVWLAHLSRDLTALGGNSLLGLLVLSVCGFLWTSQRRSLAAYLLFTALGGLLLVYAVKSGIGRPRPEWMVHGVLVTSSSFPSAHAANATVVYSSLAALLAQGRGYALKLYLGAISTSIVGVVGATRVYLGVHWPSDVFAGWALGAAWSAGCWLLVGHRICRDASRFP
jgi:undecaprenyl-diphosphatase